MRSADGPRRHEVAKRLLAALRADVMALQEVSRSPVFDQAAELAGDGWTVLDLPGGDINHEGESLASRLPIVRADELDVPVVDDTEGGWRATALAAELAVPTPVGSVLIVHHRGTYELHREDVRERQAVATARWIEQLIAGRPELPVVLLGDLNAGPDSASLRFLTGRQSLDGLSVRYEDAWEAVNPGQPGHTFTPLNPLVRAGEMPLERGRRIDHVLVRSGAHGPPLGVVDCRLVCDMPVEGVWASDHFGVLAELSPPSHAPGTWRSTT
ncbi:endonuclease/exonuclease/phosphatase family metal-dependent hydrolase [Solirubrobacter pauli]|uniref:Endonuclease/exonuclease/phosphatase family metal-dependent hydrolase n=2 Tax=Solirubrobacter pauli TaxID=166793 RepID=A0A660L8J0_9ACTN|nr:endonuclease/exonuclease/phosphatase family metal-dependent hydrolase [Solirubrobacter pauli]